MIRTYTTFGGARRASPQGPILRLLDDPEDLFVVGLSGRGIVSAVNSTGKVDGSIEVVELMAGGTNEVLTSRKAERAVLDAVKRERGEMRGLDMADVLRFAGADALAARSGDLTSRRKVAISAAARLILAVELIDEDLGRPE